MGVPMAISSEQLITVVRSMISREAASDWARLRRTPSTYTWRCLDHLASLSLSHQGALHAAFANRAPVLLGLEPPPAKWQDPRLIEFYEAVLQVPSRHVSARLLRGMAAAKLVDGPSGPFSDLPGPFVQKANSINPTNASQIRKEVKGQFKEQFGTSAENMGAGNWLYRGTFSNRQFSVLIDYGGMGDQLRYWLQLSDSSTGIRTKTLSYEALLGVGLGHWDFVTADTLPNDISLLSEFIQELVALPERLASLGPA